MASRSEEWKRNVSLKLSGRKQSLERRIKTSGPLNGSWKGGIPEKVCVGCKIKFKSYNTIYCSKKCYE